MLESAGDSEWIDLTHSYSSEMAHWPTAKPFALHAWTGQTPMGQYLAANDLELSEHCGTHVDAPCHVFPDGRGVHELRLDELMGHGAVLDMSEQTRANRNHAISSDDILSWEARHGQIPEAAIVLFSTGLAAAWPDAAAFLGTAELGDDAVRKMTFPGLSGEAATWLVQHRRPKAVGIDVPSIDPAQSLQGPKSLAAHHAILGADIPVFENVANLSLLPPHGAWIMGLPMKVLGGTASPLRIIARVAN